MSKILIVDDDAHIRDVIGFALETAGFTVDQAGNGDMALRMIGQAPPDLVILDIGMPGTDGLEVCRQIRKTSNLPILFLTARSDEIDRVVGLEIGGDDYVTKPFSPRELVARVRAILKRSTAAGPDTTAALAHGLLRVDPDRHACTFDGQDIHLTNSEFSVLMALMARPENVLSRSQLLTHVYGNNIHVSDRTLDSHVRNLRQKLAQAGCETAIKTVHGVGLRLDTCLR